MQTQWPESMDYFADCYIEKLKESTFQKHKYFNHSPILLLLYK